MGFEVAGDQTSGTAFLTDQGGDTDIVAQQYDQVQQRVSTERATRSSLNGDISHGIP